MPERGSEWDEDTGWNTRGMLRERSTAFSGYKLNINEYAICMYSIVIGTAVIQLKEQF